MAVTRSLRARPHITSTEQSCSLCASASMPCTLLGLLLARRALLLHCLVRNWCHGLGFTFTMFNVHHKAVHHKACIKADITSS